MKKYMRVREAFIDSFFVFIGALAMYLILTTINQDERKIEHFYISSTKETKSFVTLCGILGNDISDCKNKAYEIYRFEPNAKEMEFLNYCKQYSADYEYCKTEAKKAKELGKFDYTGD